MNKELDEILREHPPHLDPMAIEVEKKQKQSQLAREKKEIIDKLEVKVNSIIYGADNTSQLRMTTLNALAVYVFQKTIGIRFKDKAKDSLLDDRDKVLLNIIGGIFEETYDEVYKDTKVSWKGADNKPHNVSIKSVIEANKKAIEKVGEIIMEHTIL